MNSRKKSDICIIGAGISGLTVGALLTKKGYTVNIFEKESQIGGRALSLNGNNLTLEKYTNLLSHYNMNIPFSDPSVESIIEKKLLKGYTWDLGFHAIGGGAVSILRDVLTQFGEHVEMLESSTGFIKGNGFDIPFLSRSDKIRMFPHILRLLLSGESTMKKLDNVSMTKTIEKYGKGKMRVTLEVFSRAISTINDLDSISTGEMFRAQKILLKGSKPVGYPKNGLQSLSQVFMDIITRNGGQVNLNSPVSEIIIEKKETKGVIVNDEEYLCKTVVSSMLTQHLFTIINEKEFPPSYVQYMKSLKGTAGLCAYYSLDKINPQLIGKTFLFIERNVGIEGNDAVGMIDFMTALPTSGLAPPSHHLIQAYIICTPAEARNKKTLEMLKELLDKNLTNLMPDCFSHMKWAIYPAVWHLDGVAKTINDIKPDIKTPIKNLYLIGDCVKAPGVGMNCAINSAIMLNNILLSDA